MNSLTRSFVLGTALCLACGGPPSQPAAPAPAAITPVATTPLAVPLNAAASTPADDTTEPPPSFAPKTFQVLGPLPNPLGAAGTRIAMRNDLLSSLGGEARATITPSTSLTGAGQTFAAKTASADPAGIVDLVALYQGNTDLKVAYAYAEFDAPAAGPALAVVGSDDAVAVWLNGTEVHRNVTDRALKVGEDRFPVSLVKGRNRILLKVDNGGGGWAFAVSIYDAAAQRKLEALRVRRHLEEVELVSADGEFFLKDAFPKLAFAHPLGASTVLGEPHVRWFDPALTEVDHPERDGRYVALVEAPSRNGRTYRRMVTFAKFAKGVSPSDLPSKMKPWPGKQPPLGVLEEVSKHAAGAHAIPEVAAITALALAKDEPKALAWFDTPFFLDLEHKLALRLKLEGREPKAFAPPTLLAKPAGKLRIGSEAEAGMKPGTVQKLRALMREWAKADSHPFVVLLARQGVIFMHEGFNGMAKDSLFRSASIAKSISGLTFARAVEQGLVGFDQPLASVFPGYASDATRDLTFRRCFYHLSGLENHRSHGGLFAPFLDNDFLIQDFPFKAAGTRFLYNGDDVNLAMMALSLSTGRSVPRLYNEHLQAPFEEPVAQLDGGTSGMSSATYLAKVGQMLLQDGKYGRYQFYSPGFLGQIMPKKAAEYAPGLDDKQYESGIGLTWMPDPDGPREKGVLGANVVGHGSAAGIYWRVAFEQQLVAVVGRNDFDNWQANEAWGDRLAAALAENIRIEFRSHLVR